MDNGLTLQWVVKLLKEVYVEVAQEEFSIAGTLPTNSRISLITGVHRKDIANLLDRGGMVGDVASPTLLSARLLAKWLGEKRFCNDAGEPLMLQRHAGESDEPSFEELVSLTSKDIRSKPVLDEWLNLGLVAINDNGLIELQAQAFLPSKDHDQKLYFLGKNVSDHLAAARTNTQSDKPPFLERSVYYGELSLNSLVKLEQLSRIEGMKMLHCVNRAANELQNQDRKIMDEKHSGRMNLGVYYYHQHKGTEDGSIPSSKK
jgi:hypothetical protein